MDIEKITMFFTNDNEKRSVVLYKRGIDKKGTKRKGKSKGDWICQGGGS